MTLAQECKRRGYNAYLGTGLMPACSLKPIKVKFFFSDEAYGFITCGAEPPHNVKVNVNTPYPAAFYFDFVWRL